MLIKKSLFVVLIASMIMGNVAEANFGDALVGGIVGGVVGSVITNEVYHKKRHRKKRHKVKKRHVAKKHVKKRYVAPKPKIETTEMKIQKSLTALGFYRGKIDGEVNSYETRSAIKEMNRVYELGDTASLSQNSRDTLIYLSDLFTFDRILIAKDNSTKGKAKKIQAALKIHGFYHDKIDGAIGAGTRRNIAEYKSVKGLSSGSSFDFEEEYQLISSAKQLNDKNLDDATASLKGISRRQVNQVPSSMPQSSGIVLQKQRLPEQPYIPKPQRIQAQKNVSEYQALPNNKQIVPAQQVLTNSQQIVPIH